MQQSAGEYCVEARIAFVSVFTGRSLDDEGGLNGVLGGGL
jgi:hypothetical protein